MGEPYYILSQYILVPYCIIVCNCAIMKLLKFTFIKKKNGCVLFNIRKLLGTFPEMESSRYLYSNSLERKVHVFSFFIVNLSESLKKSSCDKS